MRLSLPVRVLAVTTVLAGALLGTSSHTPADAATPTCTATSTGVTRLPTDKIWRALMSCTMTVEAGKQYLFGGKWTATSSWGSLMETRVEAYPVGATSSSQRIRSSVASRNHEGTENGLPPGTQRSISTRWLFTAPTSGDYVIELRADAGRENHKEYYVDVVPQGTSLSLAGVYQRGLEWTQPDALRFGNPNSPVSPRPRAVDALWKTYAVPAGTRSVQVWTGTGVSVESTGGGAPLHARLTAYARQLNATGAYCNVVSNTTEQLISGTLHHYRFNQVLTLDLDQSCGTNNVNVKVYVEYVPAAAGTPERHGGVVHAAPYSAAHIIPMG